jgi:hyperosmotically inducible protein
VTIKRNLWAAAFASGILAFPATTAFSAENTDAQAVEVSAQPRFDNKINTWMEGSILSINAESGKISVRGAKRPYATAYAKMMNEIFDKTQNLQGADKQAKETEIRAAWHDKLAKAQREPNERDSDFTFSLPAKSTIVTSFDESRYYGKDYEYTPVPNRAKGETDKETINTQSLKNLRVGEHVVVGYDAGLIRNDVYVVFKANYADLPVEGAAMDGRTATGTAVTEPAATDHNAVTPTAADNTKVNQRDRNRNEVTADQQKQNTPDIELTRNIRRALVKDDSLSTYAHNVKIITQNGNVTLKGPVRSDVEKEQIEKKALELAGQGHVSNQLDVAP